MTITKNQLVIASVLFPNSACSSKAFTSSSVQLLYVNSASYATLCDVESGCYSVGNKHLAQSSCRPTSD